MELLNVPLLDFLLALLQSVIPLDPIDRDIARLSNNIRLILSIPELPEQVQAALITQRTQRLSSLVPAHGIFLLVHQHLPQRLDRSIVARLAETVREFMLEQCRRRPKARSNSLDRGDSLFTGRLQRSEVLEREEGAEAARKRLLLRGKDLAQLRDLGRLGFLWRGHVGGLEECYKNNKEYLVRRKGSGVIAALLPKMQIEAQVFSGGCPAPDGRRGSYQILLRVLSDLFRPRKVRM